MRRSTLLVLAASALALGLWLLLDARPRGGGEAPGPQGRVLPGFQPQQVQRLTLLSAGRRLVLAPDPEGEGWSLGGQISGPADPARVSELLAALEFLEPLKQRPAGATPEGMGLAPPALVLEIRHQGRTERLELGREDPFAQGVFLRGPSGQVVVAPARLAALLSGDPGRLRRRRLLQIPESSIQGISLRLAGRVMELRRAAGGWTLQGSGAAGAGDLLAADSRVVTGILSRILSLEARVFPGSAAALTGEAMVRLGWDGADAAIIPGPACPGRTDLRLVQVTQAGRGPAGAPMARSTLACVSPLDLAAIAEMSPDDLVSSASK